ncbi:hypothetical protein HHI36_019888 [Cryptolaemus montrouzieri]|uniref:Uncharacterized protein n=1 Tax=Cryptolaemus montrouzieri TaxID=559131 RepID=A0ABD2N8Y9_9CUCU
MTPREHRDAKKKWKEHCNKYHNEKKVLENFTNSLIKENTPDSDVPTSCQMSTPEVAEIIEKNKNKEKLPRYKSREKMKKLKIPKESMKNVSRAKKILNPKPVETPNTKLQNSSESRKDLIKIAFFGEVLKQQIQDNFSEIK